MVDTDLPFRFHRQSQPAQWLVPMYHTRCRQAPRCPTIMLPWSLPLCGPLEALFVLFITFPQNGEQLHCIQFHCVYFTAAWCLYIVQTMLSQDSVCLSVCHMPVLCQTLKHSCFLRTKHISNCCTVAVIWDIRHRWAMKYARFAATITTLYRGTGET